MRHLKIAGLLAGASLALCACGSGGEANNAADDAALNAEIGNFGDPSAVETMGNAAAPPPANASDAGEPANGTAPPPMTTDATPNDPTDVGGDLGGNAAGGTTNGM